jgi:hypothetical membrane protein
MDILNLKKIPLTSVGSFLTIIITLACGFVSSLSYNGQFSIISNWISDLGSSSKNPNGHFYFDIGCILTGIALLFSIAGLIKWRYTNRKQNNLIKLSQYCGFLMAFALIMIGIYSEDYGRIHYFWASIYFVLTFVFLIIVNIALKNHPHYMTWIYYYTYVSILINFSFILLVIFGFHFPILEWLSVLSGLLWIWLIGYNTLKF